MARNLGREKMIANSKRNEDEGNFEHTVTRYEDKAHFGQIIMSETSPDKSSYHVNEEEALKGRELRGNELDLSHSINRRGDVETYNDVPAKPRPFRGDRINKPEK